MVSRAWGFPRILAFLFSYTFGFFFAALCRLPPFVDGDGDTSKPLLLNCLPRSCDFLVLQTLSCSSELVSLPSLPPFHPIPLFFLL